MWHSVIIPTCSNSFSRRVCLHKALHTEGTSDVDVKEDQSAVWTLKVLNGTCISALSYVRIC